MTNKTYHSTKAKALLLAFILLLSVALLPACSGVIEEKNTFSVEAIADSLGNTREDAAKKLAFDAGSDTKTVTYEDAEAEMKLEFENDRLFRVHYDFGTNTDAAFKFVNELYKAVEEKYGESDTYETMPDRIYGLTEEAYLSGDVEQYKEYWIDTDVDFGGVEVKNSKRVDLGIGFKRFPTADVYIGGIINSINTTKLPK